MNCTGANQLLYIIILNTMYLALLHIFWLDGNALSNYFTIVSSVPFILYLYGTNIMYTYMSTQT